MTAQINADYSVLIQVNNADGSPFNLTGVSLQTDWKNAPGQTPFVSFSTEAGGLLIQSPATAGQVLLTANTALMTTLPIGSFFWDLIQIVDEDDNIFLGGGTGQINTGITDCATPLLPNTPSWQAASGSLGLTVTVPAQNGLTLTLQPSGPPGEPGPPGADGPPGLNWRGAWSSTATYAVDDGVSFNGSSYIAILPSVGETPNPVSSNYWDLLAAQGLPGSSGASAMGVVSSLAQLRTITGSAWAAGTYSAVYLTSYYANAQPDAGGGHWTWDSVSTAADDAFSCIIPTGWGSAGRVVRPKMPVIWAEQAGVIFESGPQATVVNDAAMLALINYARSISGAKILMSGGFIGMNDVLDLRNYPGVYFEGAGLGQCTLQRLSTGTANDVTWWGATSAAGPVITFNIGLTTSVNWTAHGLQPGQIVQFLNTGGNLPTNVSGSDVKSSGKNYYVIASGLTANSFEISASLNGPVLVTSGTQSGTTQCFIALPKITAGGMKKMTIDCNGVAGRGIHLTSMESGRWEDLMVMNAAAPSANATFAFQLDTVTTVAFSNITGGGCAYHQIINVQTNQSGGGFTGAAATAVKNAGNLSLNGYGPISDSFLNTIIGFRGNYVFGDALEIATADSNRVFGSTNFTPSQFNQLVTGQSTLNSNAITFTVTGTNLASDILPGMLVRGPGYPSRVSVLQTVPGVGQQTGQEVLVQAWEYTTIETVEVSGSTAICTLSQTAFGTSPVGTTYSIGGASVVMMDDITNSGDSFARDNTLVDIQPAHGQFLALDCNTYTTFTGNTSNSVNKNVITGVSSQATAVLQPGWFIYGNGFNYGALIQSVDPVGGTVTLGNGTGGVFNSNFTLDGVTFSAAVGQPSGPNMIVPHNPGNQSLRHLPQGFGFAQLPYLSYHALVDIGGISTSFISTSDTENQTGAEVLLQSLIESYGVKGPATIHYGSNNNQPSIMMLNTNGATTTMAVDTTTANLDIVVPGGTLAINGSPLSFNFSGVYYSTTTPVATPVGTAKSLLQSFETAAGFFTTAGTMFVVRASFWLGNDANEKTVTFNYGTGTNAVNFTTTSNGSAGLLLYIESNGVNSQTMWGAYTDDSGTQIVNPTAMTQNAAIGLFMEIYGTNGVAGQALTGHLVNASATILAIPTGDFGALTDGLLLYDLTVPTALLPGTTVYSTAPGNPGSAQMGSPFGVQSAEWVAQSGGVGHSLTATDIICYAFQVEFLGLA